MENIDIINIAKELNDYILKNKEHHVNIIDELHANENAHSRILSALLSYKGEKSDYPILSSFLTIPSIKNVLGKNFILDNPSITCESECIDVLIEQPGKYAIIIENKINNANDQETQIERYLKKVKKHNIALNKIYVVYLTKDGSKIISDESLTDEAKKILEYTENSCRFIPLNYKEDILPWLNDKVLPSCIKKEKLLFSAIVQYIDYLQGMFNLRDLDIENKKIEFIKEKMEIQDIKKCNEILDEINQLYYTIEENRNKLVKEIIQKSIIEPFDRFLHDYAPDCIANYSKICYDYFCLTVEIPQLKNSYFGIESDNNGLYFGLCRKTVDKQEEDNIIQSIGNIQNHDFKQTPWWAGWEYFWRISVASDSFWEYVKDGLLETELENCFELIYKNVVL